MTVAEVRRAAYAVARGWDDSGMAIRMSCNAPKP